METLVATGTTYWGKKITCPLEIVRRFLSPASGDYSQALHTTVLKALNPFFESLGVSENQRAHLRDVLLKPAKTIDSLAKFEVVANERFKDRISQFHWKQALRDRTATIVNQIKDSVKNNTSVLDVGCGDGMVSWNLRDHCSRLELVDVVDYVEHEIKDQVSFTPFIDGDAIPVAGHFDTALLITVLHHTQNPETLIKAAAQKADELLIIESVYFSESKSLYLNGPLLTSDEQFLYASFFDWLYNRVIHRGVPVTFNYAPPNDWGTLLRKHGFEVVTEDADRFGVDIPLVPEYHVMLKAERIQP